MTSAATAHDTGLDTVRVGSRVVDEYFLTHGIPALKLTGYPTPIGEQPHLAEAARRAVERPSVGPTLGLPALRKAISHRTAAATGVQIAIDEVVISNGAMPALASIWAALRAAGGDVVVPVPSYFSRGAITLTGLDYRPIDAVSTTGGWDWDRIADHISPRTQALYLVNPNNPTGSLMTQSDIDAVCAIADAHPDLWIVADESYEVVVFDDHQHRSLARYRGRIANLAIVGSFSKSYGLPWLRVGWIIAPPHLVSKLRDVMEWLNLYGAHVNQHIALAAVEGDSTLLRRSLADLGERRLCLVDMLRPLPNLTVEIPPAGPFVYPHIDGVGPLSNGDVRALWDAGVGAIPASAFGSSAACMRIPFGGPDREDLHRAAAAIGEWVTTATGGVTAPAGVRNLT